MKPLTDNMKDALLSAKPVERGQGDGEALWRLPFGFSPRTRHALRLRGFIRFEGELTDAGVCVRSELLAEDTSHAD